MPAPNYLRVAAALRRRIRDGDFPVGAALPSRATIRDEYGLNLQSVNTVMIILWALGYTEGVSGLATYVRQADPPEDPAVAEYLDSLA